MKIIKFWCEWDMGIDELHSSEEALIEKLEEIEWSEVLALVDNARWQTLHAEGFLGWETVDVQ